MTEETRPNHARLPEAEYLPRVTVAQRAARGRQCRKDVPFGQHAEVTLGGRGDPIATLQRQSAQRVPELVPIRYGRMAASPFAFYRGAAAIMAGDLAGTAVSGARAQLCGDAHLMNFGLFDTPERALIFGLNDFDETLPGPVEWDVKRLAASVEIAGRDLGFSSSARESAVLAAVRSYREAMLEFAALRDIELWYTRLPADALLARLSAQASHRSAKEVKREVNKALRRDHLRAFDRLIKVVDDELHFVSEPPLIVPVEELLGQEERAQYVEVMQDFLRQYRASLTPQTRALMERYRFEQIARKVVGVGSVGTQAWVVLMTGRDSADPLILQVKEANHSVLEPYTSPSVYESQGRRVIEGQRFMQAASDSLLGHYRLRSWDGHIRDFYVRQLWDGKASVDVARLSPSGLRAYGDACGWTLARGHARSGDRVAMAAYLGEGDGFDRALVEFASAYAEVNESDHARLAEAIDAGQLSVQTGI